MGWEWERESYTADKGQQHMWTHPLTTTTVDYLSTISPAQWFQAFYLLAAGCVLLVASTPAEARGLLVNYGARKATSSTTSSLSSSLQVKESKESKGTDDENTPEKKTEKKPETERKNIFLSLVALVTSYGQIPHSWFGAFYLVSAACSLSWAAQYHRLLYLTTTATTTNSKYVLPLYMIASKQVSTTSSPDVMTTTQAQLFLAWAMLFLQATRRIYEHLAIIKPSKSTMWFVHWVLGLGFYIVTNVAIWVEGSATILSQPTPQNLQSFFLLLNNNNTLTTENTNKIDIDIDPTPLIKILLGTPIFLYAWKNQYKTHRHLANLVKYSLPDPQKEPLFRYLISPHYTCECLLYLSIAIVAAPKDHYINTTLLCALVFVLVNLGVTAKGTRQWYADKFGEKAVRGKWNMIPFVF